MVGNRDAIYKMLNSGSVTEEKTKQLAGLKLDIHISLNAFKGSYLSDRNRSFQIQSHEPYPHATIGVIPILNKTTPLNTIDICSCRYSPRPAVIASLITK